MNHPSPPASPSLPLTAVEELFAAFIDPSRLDFETNNHRDLFEDVNWNYSPQPGPVLNNSSCSFKHPFICAKANPHVATNAAGPSLYSSPLATLGVPSPSLFGGTSTQSLRHDEQIQAAINDLIGEPRLLLDIIIQREVDARQHPFMTISGFKRDFPVGKGLYYRISTLTKTYVFTDRSYKWNPACSLSSETSALILGHAHRAVDRMTEAHSTKLAMAPDDGVYNHIAAICRWAFDDVLEEVEWIRREGRSIVDLMFHFVDGEVAKNIARYNLATKDYWYIRFPIAALALFQRVVFLSRKGLAWQTEKLLQDYDILTFSTPRDLPVRSWSDDPNSILLEICFMVIRHDLEEFRTGAWERLPFSSWDVDVMEEVRRYCATHGHTQVVQLYQSIAQWWSATKEEIDFQSPPGRHDDTDGDPDA